MPNNLHLDDTSIVRPDDRSPERLISTESICQLQALAQIKGKTSERAIAACWRRSFPTLAAASLISTLPASPKQIKIDAELAESGAAFTAVVARIADITLPNTRLPAVSM
jgi:hypothetical protein